MSGEPIFLVVDSGRLVTVFTDKVDLKVGWKSPRTCAKTWIQTAGPDDRLSEDRTSAEIG